MNFFGKEGNCGILGKEGKKGNRGNCGILGKAGKLRIFVADKGCLVPTNT